jgi:hypothetical protein
MLSIVGALGGHLRVLLEYWRDPNAIPRAIGDC